MGPPLRGDIAAAQFLLLFSVVLGAPRDDPECPIRQRPLQDVRLRPERYHPGEEAVRPPENYRALMRIREAGLPVATGENAISVVDFDQIIEDRAADILQPSVTKIGGISMMRDIFALADRANAVISPHSACFGPWLVAMLHFCAVLSPAPLVERLFCTLADGPLGPAVNPRDGIFTLPDAPGLRVEVNERLLECCRVG